MKQVSKDRLKGTLGLTCGLVVATALHENLFGWDLIPTLAIWFFIVPALSIFLPGLFSSSKDHFFESMTGLFIYYAILVFCGYKYYGSDFFNMMVISLPVNSVIIMLTARFHQRPNSSSN